jgi:hypothetical protein
VQSSIISCCVPQPESHSIFISSVDVGSLVVIVSGSRPEDKSQHLERCFLFAPRNFDEEERRLLPESGHQLQTSSFYSLQLCLPIWRCGAKRKQAVGSDEDTFPLCGRLKPANPTAASPHSPSPRVFWSALKTLPLDSEGEEDFFPPRDGGKTTCNHRHSFNWLLCKIIIFTLASLEGDPTSRGARQTRMKRWKLLCHVNAFHRSGDDDDVGERRGRATTTTTTVVVAVEWVDGGKKARSWIKAILWNSKNINKVGSFRPRSHSLALLNKKQSEA